MCRAILQCDLPATSIQRTGVRHHTIKANVLPEVKAVDIAVKIFSDLRMMGKHRIILRHGIIRILHARPGGVDEKRFIGTAHLVCHITKSAWLPLLAGLASGALLSRSRGIPYLSATHISSIL